MAQAKHATTSNQNSLSAGHVLNRRPIEVLPRPELTTQRLVFRLLNPNDKRVFMEALQHSRGALRRWVPLNHEGETDARFFNRTMIRARMHDIEGLAWRRAAFIDHGPDAGRFVGMFNLINIQRGLEWSCEANWWVDSRLTGRGLASEATQGMLDFAFADHPCGLGMHLVRGYICTDNHASVRVAQKCGMVNTGKRELLGINKALVQHHEFECWVS